MDFKLCVIIPTYNNQGTIKDVVLETLHYCNDVIVVNDGCTDNTQAILTDIQNSLPREGRGGAPIEIVEYGRNCGKGYALLQGFRRAKELGYTHAITIDADGQHFPADIPLLIAKLQECPQGIIVGSRNLAEKNMPGKNTFANNFSNFWFHLQTGINLPDTQCGFRLYTLSALHGLRMITSRYESELEFLVYAAWAGEKIVSVPVRVYYPPEGERVTHFRPTYDFTRISILNTFLCLGALFIMIRQAAYTVFAFCYFLKMALELTVKGFFMLTLGGATPGHKLKFHELIQRRTRWVTAHIPGTTLAYSNPTGETFSRPAVIISNHQSHLDLMAIMMLTPKLIIMTKDWVWNNPIYGRVIRYADYFPINDTEEMTENLKKKVEEGYSIMIFPEGTRSEDCRILRFHRGAFYLAEQLGLDIVPVFIDGFGQALPKKSYHLHPAHLTVNVLPRIHRDNPQEMKGYREMTKELHRVYLNMKK